MEMLSVYNKDEVLLDKKVLRGSIMLENEYIMITYIFIFNKENKLLLERNASSGKWVIPGGHVTDDAISSIVRECNEELGIIISKEYILEVSTLSHNNRFFKLFYYSGIIDDEFKLQKEEVSEVKYYSLDEIDILIKEGLFRENNIEFILELKKYLGK